MKTLWTPWRMEHVLGQAATPDGCLFEPDGDTVHDKKALLLYRDALCLVLLNRFPYTNGHLLVAPRRHVACITELSMAESNAVMEMIKQAVTILTRQLHPDGINVGCNLGSAAGAGIADHLHFHLVPRWQEDHNFITVIGEVRTIPEHIDATFEKLLPDFLDLYEHSQRNTL